MLTASAKSLTSSLRAAVYLSSHLVWLDALPSTAYTSIREARVREGADRERRCSPAAKGNLILKERARISYLVQHVVCNVNHAAPLISGWLSGKRGTYNAIEDDA